MRLSIPSHRTFPLALVFHVAQLCTFRFALPLAPSRRTRPTRVVCTSYPGSTSVRVRSPNIPCLSRVPFICVVPP